MGGGRRGESVTRERHTPFQPARISPPPQRSTGSLSPHHPPARHPSPPCSPPPFPPSSHGGGLWDVVWVAGLRTRRVAVGVPHLHVSQQQGQQGRRRLRACAVTSVRAARSARVHRVRCPTRPAAAGDGDSTQPAARTRSRWWAVARRCRHAPPPPSTTTRMHACMPTRRPSPSPLPPPPAPHTHTHPTLKLSSGR